MKIKREEQLHTVGCSSWKKGMFLFPLRTACELCEHKNANSGQKTREIDTHFYKRQVITSVEIILGFRKHLTNAIICNISNKYPLGSYSLLQL